MRRDPNAPIIAREITNYAWWRALVYNIGVDCFYQLANSAGLMAKDQEDSRVVTGSLGKP